MQTETLLAGLISCVPTVTHAKYVTFVGALYGTFPGFFLGRTGSQDAGSSCRPVSFTERCESTMGKTGYVQNSPWKNPFTT